MDVYDLIIIGGGPAGLTAAIYASRASLNVLLLAGSPAGGQLTITTDVENFPGFDQAIMGPKLIEQMRTQAEKFGTKAIDENVVSIEGDNLIGFQVDTDSKNMYKTKSIIVASGASAKWLGLSNEQRLIGRGVSACATCDGFFFKNKIVAVVGGGDSAMEEALFLTKFASKVYILVRGKKEEVRASKYLFEKAMVNVKIHFVFNVDVVDVLGVESVSGLQVNNNLTNEQIKMDDVQGLFVAVGHKPNTEFLKGFIDLDELGYVFVKNGTLTSKEGVFVSGDVSDKRYRQAVTAAGYGCMAALDAEKYLADHSH